MMKSVTNVTNATMRKQNERVKYLNEMNDVLNKTPGDDFIEN